MFLHEIYFFFIHVHARSLKEVEETKRCLFGKWKDGCEFDYWANKVTRCCSHFGGPGNGICAEVKLYNTSFLENRRCSYLYNFQLNILFFTSAVSRGACVCERVGELNLRKQCRKNAGMDKKQICVFTATSRPNSQRDQLVKECLAYYFRVKRVVSRLK